MRDPISILIRCAATGRRFHACFLWSPAQEKYVLYSMLPEVQREQGAPLPALRERASVVAPYTPMPGNGASPPRHEQLASPPLDDVKSSEVDFTGFHCPHCGYGKTTPAKTHWFVKCSVCGELVCGSRITSEGAVEVFHCHERCGARSGLSGSGGGLESYQARILSGEGQEAGAVRLVPSPLQALTGSTQAKLPASGSPGLPGKKLG